MKSPQYLLPFVQKYVEKNPVDAARSLETMNESEAIEALKFFPTKVAAEVTRHLPDAYAASLLQRLPVSMFAKIIQHLDAQQGASIVLCLEKDRRQVFIDSIEDKKRKEIQDILSYPEDSAGRIMSTQVIAFHNDIPVKNAIHKIRQFAQKGPTASYVYVVDHANHLVGILNMRDLMLAPEEAALETVMRKELFTVHCFTDREVIADELSNRRLFAAPVVDGEKRLLGVVKAERLIDHVQEEASEDIQKMFGAGGDETTFSPISFSLRRRLPWLHVNLLTAFLAAGVVALFEATIARITVLAVCLPIVAGQGGNAGAQSLAVVMRGIVMREIPRHQIPQLLFKESLIGAVNGIVIGVVTGVAAWLWQGNPFLGLVIGLGMLVNLCVAGFAGAAIPITMKALRLDPAQCSSIILTTITDVMGFFAFLGFAVMFQDYLR